MKTISATEVRSLLDYDSLTGVFRWSAKRRWRKDLCGAVAGHSGKRYVTVWICGRSYSAHRLAWLYVYGQWPSFDLDHIDGNKHNNAISNLRPASRSENCCNVKVRRSSKSGLKGVSWKAEQSKWVAQIQFGRKAKFLGYFTRKEDAAAAYDRAARDLHGEFAATNGVAA